MLYFLIEKIKYCNKARFQTEKGGKKIQMKKVAAYLEENLEEIIMVTLLAALSMVMITQVVARYVFKSGFVWAEEFCRYCFVYSGMFSAGYCIRKNVSIRVDALYGFFPKALRVVIDYTGKILITLVYAYLAYGSIKLISTTTSVSTAMQLPMKYVYASIPLGFGLGAVRGVQDLVVYTKKLLAGKKEEK